VIKGRLSKNFDHQRNWMLMKKFHEHAEVQRIFVDGVIKRALCEYAHRIGEGLTHQHVLRSLRPYVNHAHHLHVRIRCPGHATNCVAQEDPPEGSGC
jgi:penicillin-insensitive murein DD-endopeptidase